MRNKNYVWLVLFVLIASLIVNISATALVQHGDASFGSLRKAALAVLTSSTDVTMAAGTLSSSSAEDEVVVAGAAQDTEEEKRETAAAPKALLEAAPSKIVSAAPTAAGGPVRAQYHVVVTAYSSTADQTDSTPFITASGSYVRDGIVAANFLPIGAKVKMPELYGDKVFTVEDRMNQRYSDRVDVWMADRTSAQQFGRRYTRIEVL